MKLVYETHHILAQPTICLESRYIPENASNAKVAPSFHTYTLHACSFALRSSIVSINFNGRGVYISCSEKKKLHCVHYYRCMQIIKLTFTFFPYVLRYNSVPVQLCFVNLRYLHLKNTTVIHVFRKITSNANMNLNMKYLIMYQRVFHT